MFGFQRYSSTRRRLVVPYYLTLFYVWLVSSVNAFIPTYGYALDFHLGSFSIPILGRPHVAMTIDAIKDLYMPYFGISSSTSSMDAARKEIADGNAQTDLDPSTAKLPAAHFDGESFVEGQQRLLGARQNIQDALNDGRASDARKALGGALHAVQDFYAHTNWVEMGQDDISQSLGRPEGLNTYLPTPPELQTCFNCTFSVSDNSLPTREENNAVANACKFGDKGFSAALTMLCMVGQTDPPDCDSNLNPQLILDQELTSGYYGGEDHDKPPGKCGHGGPFDTGADGIEGISKDSRWSYLSPHSDLHSTAADFAAKATTQFLEDIRTLICGDTAPAECPQLRLLYGIGPSIAFAIDTTGSMGSIISGVQEQAVNTVNSRRGTADEPSLYVLSPFNDPETGPVTTTTDPDTFIAQIMALTADGGGDCPELAMAGLLGAINASVQGGDVFLWTDAAAKDVDLASEASDLAYNKSVRVTNFLFPSECSSSDGFDEVSDSSAGQSIPADVTEANTVTTLADFLIQGNGVDILLVGDETDTGPVEFARHRRQADISYDYDIPVDSSLTDLFLSFSSLSANVTLKKPDGSSISADADTTIITITNGLLVHISNPVVGTWTAIVSSTGNTTGNFTLSVTGAGSLHLSTFDFVEFKGRPGHEGFFPIDGEPTPGSIILAMSTLEGNFSDAKFEYRSKNGVVLDRFDLVPGSGEADDIPSNIFFGNTTIPDSSFLIYVTGQDAAGQRYQRLLRGGLILSSLGSLPNPPPSSSIGSSSTPYPRSTRGIYSSRSSYLYNSFPVHHSIGTMIPTVKPCTHLETVSSGDETSVLTKHTVTTTTITTSHLAVCLGSPTYVSHSAKISNYGTSPMNSKGKSQAPKGFDSTCTVEDTTAETIEAYHSFASPSETVCTSATEAPVVLSDKTVSSVSKTISGYDGPYETRSGAFKATGLDNVVWPLAIGLALVLLWN